VRVSWFRVLGVGAASVVVSTFALGGVAYGQSASLQLRASGHTPRAALSVPLYGHHAGGPPVPFNYQGGAVLLSSTADGTGSTTYSTSIVIHVQHPDGSTVNFTHDYQGPAVFVTENGTFSYECPPPPDPLAPMDLSSLFAPGRNEVTAIGFNRNEGICAGSDLGGGSVYLVPDFSENHRA
jgi:hypothetical protein